MMTSPVQVVTTRWRVNEKMRAVTLFGYGDLLKTMQVLLLHMRIQSFGCVYISWEFCRLFPRLYSDSFRRQTSPKNHRARCVPG